MKRSDYPNQQLEEALPVLDALIFDELERSPDYIPEIFRVKTIGGWGEQTLTMAGIQQAPEKSEGAAVFVDSAIEGYSKTYLPVTYAISIVVSEELKEDNRLSLLEDTYRSLGLSMYQTRQVTAFNVFNDGFSDTGPDGVSLFNTAHPMIGGHSYANRPSTDIAFSIAGMREMEVDMMRQVNHRNINVHLMPRTIIVPPELAQSAYEVLRSPERPDTDNRAINTFHGSNYKLIVSPFLTSETAWFAIADKTQHQLRFYDRVAPSSKTWEDEKTGDINTRIRCRFDVGYSDFPGAWGTTG